MAKALLVTSSFLPGKGGIESYLAELCDEIAPDLAVLAPERRSGEVIPQNLPYPTSSYPYGLMLPTRQVLQMIHRSLADHGVGKVLFGTPWPLILLGPRLRAAGIPYSSIVHGAEVLVPSSIPILRQRLARALSAADLLLPVSDYTGRQVADFLRRIDQRVPPATTLRARVDLERFHPDTSTAAVKARLGLKDERVLLCLGRLVRRKGIDRLIAAAEAVAAEGHHLTVVVAGTGPDMKRLERIAQRSSVRVVFAGRVSNEDSAALYSLADVFVLAVADRYRGLEVEGLGVVLLEAQASGTPCVTGASGGTNEAVVDGETGFVVDATDFGLLAAKISWLLNNTEEARRMGLAGRGYVRREFAARRIPESLVRWLG